MVGLLLFGGRNC